MSWIFRLELNKANQFGLKAGDLKNAANLNNLLLLEGFAMRLKLEDGNSHHDRPNSTSSIDTTHATLVKAVCIYAGYSHTNKIKEKNRWNFFN